MSIIYINSEEKWNIYVNQFKDNSRICSNPYIYHVGLDCEYISKSNYPDSFESSKKWTFKQDSGISVCILQLACHKMCLVINLTTLGPYLPPSLIEILVSGSWIKTGVGIDLDILYLSDNFNLSQCAGYVDLKTYGFIAGLSNPKLDNLG